MSTYRRITLILLAVAVVGSGIAGPAMANEPRKDVVREADIQVQIDQQVDSQAADRQAIQDLLRRPDVRRIAGAAGLDIERASAAAALLSGSELKSMAASAHQIHGAVGGADKVTVAVTTIIIIALLVIILAS